MQVITDCIADGVSLRPGTYNGEEYLHSAANTYALWPPKHVVPVKVTQLVEQGVIRSLD